MRQEDGDERLLSVPLTHPLGESASEPSFSPTPSLPFSCHKYFCLPFTFPRLYRDQLNTARMVKAERAGSGAQNVAPTTRRSAQAGGFSECVVENYAVRNAFAGKREADGSSASHLPAFHLRLRSKPVFNCGWHYCAAATFALRPFIFTVAPALASRLTTYTSSVANCWRCVSHTM